MMRMRFAENDYQYDDIYSVEPPTECGPFGHDGITLLVCTCGAYPVYAHPRTGEICEWWELPATWSELRH